MARLSAGADTLLAWFSKGGAAAEYAAVVADTLREHGLVVDLADLRQHRRPDLARYRNVVVGTGVRIGFVYRRARRFLKNPALRKKRVAVFLASGIAAEDPATSSSKFLEPLFRKAGIEPVSYIALPGFLPDRDKDNALRPDLARAWARQLAVSLSGRSARNAT